MQSRGGFSSPLFDASQHRHRLWELSLLALVVLLCACRALQPPIPQPTTTVLPRPSVGERLIGTYVKPQEIDKWCAEMQHYGARFIWMAVPWNVIEPQKGHFTWNRVDTAVQAARSCGLDIGFHLLAKSSWATLPPPQTQGRKTPSMPPKDMDDYYNFLFKLASRYKGEVSRYSVENEAHASANWPSTPESYFEMLATAYRAVKAADPDALVENSGISSSALGMMVVNDILRAGKEQEADSFLKRYYAHYAPGRGKGEPIVVDDPEDLESLLSDPVVQRGLAWMPMLFDNHDYYDVIQLHYFGPWEEIPTVMDWVHDQLQARGTDKPIEFWEFGYGWHDMSTYDPQAHARDEAKYLATAIGEGALRVLSWQFTDYAAELGHPGLITASGPRPAAESFRVTTEKLNGTTSSARLDLGSSVWVYRFGKHNGDIIYVVWSTEPGKISLPIDAETVTVTTIAGETTSADPKALDVGESPIFVESK